MLIEIEHLTYPTTISSIFSNNNNKYYSSPSWILRCTYKVIMISSDIVEVSSAQD